MYRDYAPRGVQFYYIYKALAHPETNGYVTPYTLQERLMHVKEAEQKLGSQIPWLCDGIDNPLKHALGDAPNSEFVVDPDGIIVRKRQWSRPNELRADLEELVGPVENPTRPEDLNLPQLAPPAIAPRGVVPRITVPARMVPLVIEPQESREPYYVKLRAEAEPSLLNGGNGKLYLGFHCDPLYHVHWNNLAEPIRVRISGPEGMSVTPGQWQGPQVSVPSDIDPRELLVEVADWSDGALRVVVDYFACNDEEGWCKPVHQEYLVYRRSDRDGGSVRNRRTESPPAASNQPPPRGAPGAPGAGLAGRLTKVDLQQGRIEVLTPRGPRSLPVAQNARIMLDGQRADLRQLQAGWPVRLRIAPGTEGPEVIGIQSRSQPNQRPDNR